MDRFDRAANQTGAQNDHDNDGTQRPGDFAAGDRAAAAGSQPPEKCECKRTRRTTQDPNVVKARYGFGNRSHVKRISHLRCEAGQNLGPQSGQRENRRRENERQSWDALGARDRHRNHKAGQAIEAVVRQFGCRCGEEQDDEGKPGEAKTECGRARAADQLVHGWPQ